MESWLRSLELIYVTPSRVNTSRKIDDDLKLSLSTQSVNLCESFCEVWAGDSSVLSSAPTYSDDSVQR